MSVFGDIFSNKPIYYTCDVCDHDKFEIIHNKSMIKCKSCGAKFASEGKTIKR